MSGRLSYAPASLLGESETRYLRRSGVTPDDADPRSPAQKDCDRLLYATSFRRLGEVTQVAPFERAGLLHNRLTHTVKVAHIAKRLAQRLILKSANEFDPEKVELAKNLGGLDPDVVDAAAMAHDLGHPPFGHITEELLDEILTGKEPKINTTKVFDGYEGNAQSFRIVTKLELRAHGREDLGLDLTRATLNALLKYPWSRAYGGKKHRKYGFYNRTEQKAFDQIREGVEPKHEQTLEAAIMDYADDVAYAVYDLEDFYRVGLIPLDKLLREAREANGDLDCARPSREISNLRTAIHLKERRKENYDEGKVDNALKTFFRLLGVAATDHSELKAPYESLNSQRVDLRQFTSMLVNRYISAIELNPDSSSLHQSALRPMKGQEYKKSEIESLKDLTWTYVIEGPMLAAIQEGQKRMIRDIFSYFASAVEERRWSRFPRRIVDEVLRDEPAMGAAEDRLRIVSDLVSGLTENQVIDIFQSITGNTPQSVMAKLL